MGEVKWGALLRGDPLLLRPHKEEAVAMGRSPL